MQDHFWTTTLVVIYAAAVVHWSDARHGELPSIESPATRATAIRDEPIRPIPEAPAMDPAVRALGERLFHDPVLSGDRTMSCATCHVLERGGVDGLPRAIGADGLALDLNVPTVLNASLNFRQSWAGRFATLEEQVDAPLMSSSEMGTSWPELIARLEGDPTYVRAFETAFGGGPSPDRVRRAIAAYERTLLTPDSPFDAWLRGDADALEPEALAGYVLFKEYGCIGCHQGVGVGGNMFQRLGIVRDYFAERGAIGAADLGRFEVTGDEADRYVFKVPSLRNVALTAPYFHDGSAETLAEAIRVMAEYQLGREIPAADVRRIEAFLGTLTGRRIPSS